MNKKLLERIQQLSETKDSSYSIQKQVITNNLKKLIMYIEVVDPNEKQWLDEFEAKLMEFNEIIDRIP